MRQIFRDKYEILGQLASGGMATIHLIEEKDSTEKKTLVLKRIQFSKMERMFDYEEEWKPQAINEVKLLETLNHINIIKLLDSQITEKNIQMVLEYASDGDLNDRIKMHKRQKTDFKRKEIVKIMVQLTRGVEYLHRNSILHKDLKPANILFEQNILKIADLGVSRELLRGERVGDTIKYTKEYASPELITQNKAFKYEPDIWSIGCILFELCTLTRPFPRNNFHDAVFKGKYQKKLIPHKLRKFIPVLEKIFVVKFNRRIKIGKLRDIFEDMLIEDDAPALESVTSVSMITPETQTHRSSISEYNEYTPRTPRKSSNETSGGNLSQLATPGSGERERPEINYSPELKCSHRHFQEIPRCEKCKKSVDLDFCSHCGVFYCNVDYGEHLCPQEGEAVSLSCELCGVGGSFCYKCKECDEFFCKKCLRECVSCGETEGRAKYCRTHAPTYIYICNCVDNTTHDICLEHSHICIMCKQHKCSLNYNYRTGPNTDQVNTSHICFSCRKSLTLVVSCSLCHSIQNILICQYCNYIICDICLQTPSHICPNCNSLHSTLPKNYSCAICHAKQIKNYNCSICTRNICIKHIYTCICNSTICTQCAAKYKCKSCGDIKCEECLGECEICNNSVCKKRGCLKKCEGVMKDGKQFGCRRMVCPECGKYASNKEVGNPKTVQCKSCESKAKERNCYIFQIQKHKQNRESV